MKRIYYVGLVIATIFFIIVANSQIFGFLSSVSTILYTNPSPAPSSTQKPTVAPSVAPTSTSTPTPTPSPTPTPAPSPTLAPTPSASSTPTSTPEPTPVPTPTPNLTPIPTATPSPMPTPIPPPSPTPSPTPTPTPTHTPTPTPTPTVQITAYWDSACTSIVTSVDWGQIEPGGSINKTIYLRSEGTVTAILSMTISDMTPPEAGNYITISWDREAQTIDPSQILQATLICTVQSSITSSGITTFSVSINITGTA